MDITPITDFGTYSVKREDLACWTALDMPSGAKVRQYAQAAAAQPGRPILIGCPSASVMQVYVAAAAKVAGVPAIIYTTKRAVRTEATAYAAELGADVVEIRTSYLRVIHNNVRERRKELGPTVLWTPGQAILDTMAQCVNVPRSVRRIIVPAGSGATAVGVIAGIAHMNPRPDVLVIAVSTTVTEQAIREQVAKLTPLTTSFQFIGPQMPFTRPVANWLPDGTPLDPFYAAKALKFLQEGDLLWPPGLRPVCAMPRSVQRHVFDWKGPSQ